MAVGRGSAWYLLINCTQQVYRFDFATRTLTRLDRTFYRGYNGPGFPFLRRDSLHSFGGYGFWHTQGILSHYLPEKGEWEALSPTTNGPPSLLKLKEDERTLLEALREMYPKRLSRDELSVVLGTETKSLENQRKSLSETIQQINLKTHLAWGVERAIISIPTELDKRMFTYTLSEEAFVRLRSGR